MQRFTGRKAVVIKQEGEASTVPSVVAYLSNGDTAVGEAALK